MLENTFDQEMLQQCHENRVNVAILTGYNDMNEFMIGVRLTPWKQPANRSVMIIRRGDTFTEALANCMQAAQAGTWEKLAYDARPWRANVATAKWGVSAV